MTRRGEARYPTQRRDSLRRGRAALPAVDAVRVVALDQADDAGGRGLARLAGGGVDARPLAHLGDALRRVDGVGHRVLVADARVLG